MAWFRSKEQRDADAEIRKSISLLMREHVASFGGQEVRQLPLGDGGSSINLIRSASLGRGSRRSMPRLLASYAEMPGVRAVVGKIADGLASTEWCLYNGPKQAQGYKEAARKQKRWLRAGPLRRRAMRRTEEMTEVEEHPFLDLLEAGNEAHDSYTLEQLVAAHLELVGEAFLLKQRQTAALNSPTARLWIVPPNWVESVPPPNLPREQAVFIFNVGGYRQALPATEVLWLRVADPAAPYGRGTGVAGALADELDVSEFATKMTKQWFVNGGVPDLLVTAEGLAPEQTDRFEEKWSAKVSGFWRAFRPIFLNKKVEVTKLQSTFREMELGKVRDHERDVIIHTWGVSPEVFGILESSNRATIEGAWFQFARWVLVPRLEARRAAYQQLLTMEHGPGLYLDYLSPVEEDKEHRYKVMTAAPWAFPVDEWRAAAGSDPHEEETFGKRHGIPFSLTLIDPSLLPEEPPEPEPAPGEGEEEGEEEDEEKGLEPPACPNCGGITVPNAAARSWWCQSCGGNMVAMRGLTDEEEQAIIRVLTAVRTEEMEERLRPIIAEVVPVFGSLALQELGAEFSFDATAPAVEEFMKHGHQREIRFTTETTRAALRDALAEAFLSGRQEAGLAGRDLLDVIESARTLMKTVFQTARMVRALVIGLAATVQPGNFGLFSGYKQAGVPGKQWISKHDPKVRDTHAYLDEQEPIPIENYFKSPGGGEALFPGMFGDAGEDANCRCRVAPARAEPTEEEGAAPTVPMYPTAEARATAWKAWESLRAKYGERASEAAGAAFDAQEKEALAALDEALGAQ